MSDDADFGPVDYVVAEFPGNKMTGEALPIIIDLVERGIIRVLDLRFLRRETDGSTSYLQLNDLDLDGTFDVAIFEGDSSGLLDDEDLAEAAAALEPGNSAGVLVYENTWAAPFVGALRRSGAEIVASGRIPAADLLEAIERVADGDAVFSPRLAGFVLDAFAGEEVPTADELDVLTPREREVLRLIARGYTYREVARELVLSVKTVETHVSAVLRKLQLSNRRELARWAAARRLV